MRITQFAAVILAGVFYPLAAQQPTTAPILIGEPGSATVRILAFDTRGRFLGVPDVSVFESPDHKNIAGEFHGGVADGVPLGIYRVEAGLSGFKPEVRYVKVFQEHVTVIVGLGFPFEFELMLPRLHGRVVGLVPESKNSFAKLEGVFLSESMESSIAPDGGFDFGGLWPGQYLLLVVNEDGILATRKIDIPYTGPTLEIEIDATAKPPTPQ